MIIMKKGHEKTRKFSSTNTINNETFASVRCKCTCTTTKIQNSRLVVLKPDDDHLLSLLIIRKIVIKNCSAMRR